MHISFDDFCKLTPDEFLATSKAFNDYYKAKYRDEWERSRLVMYYSVMGSHLDPKKLKGKTPQKMLPFTWDNPLAKARKNGKPAKGDRDRFNKMLEKYGRKYHGKDEKAKLINNG